MSSVGNNLRTVEKVFDIIESRLRSLSEANNSHNGRATTIFGFGGVILTIAFSIYSIGKPVVWLFLLGIASILVSLLVSIIAIRSRKFWEDPYPRGLRDGYIKKEYKGVLEQVISNLIECYDHNLRITQRKALIIDCGFYCVFIGLLFLALSILL
ncbi:hypothetical protein ES702_02668 [subsurface metagenome]